MNSICRMKHKYHIPPYFQLFVLLIDVETQQEQQNAKQMEPFKRLARRNRMAPDKDSTHSPATKKNQLSKTNTKTLE